MNIGFDLDRIFIDTPPFVPNWVIDKLYKEKDNGILLYRIPGTIEQKFRQMTHARYFRPAIENNIRFLNQLTHEKKHTVFLISGRFGFLQKQTERIMKRYHLTHLFTQIFFNVQNEQPHEFKSQMIQQKKIDVFIDDDLSLLKYLAKKNPKTIFYWLNNNSDMTFGKNLFAITNLQNILPYAVK
ncbi:MAG: hypothetical protein KGJ07_04425 [Patescibacteria group bacterium]|nr:hypothetical protein [Patescibacteria group bacterium]MDE2590849.1 hypothetical protein [Patescibacteria group bacterium]